uniref:Mediator complex subunit 15 KIX domain-containing protein n=1 Tax=Musa acuminata subsp. malaccensis TaxID=214687 RepID=A0A804K4R4_MUSAM|nr:PREDICTED: mediator of RNA polymerase II transcription subunit 15a-like isoform X2 [Musa acuminata subsp. malaccensis]
MEGNSWRPAQGESAAASDGGSGDWRTQLHPEARQRIVNSIMETLKRHLPISVPEGLIEHQKIATRFEEKIYTAASDRIAKTLGLPLRSICYEAFNLRWSLGSRSNWQRDIRVIASCFWCKLDKCL